VTNGRIIDLTLYDVLHIPGLYSNPILIPKICSLGLAMIFSKNNIMASFSDRKIAIHEVQYEKLYHVKIVGELKVFMTSSVQKLYSIVSRSLTMDLTFIFIFISYFIFLFFSFLFLFLEQLGLGVISHNLMA